MQGKTISVKTVREIADNCVGSCCIETGVSGAAGKDQSIMLKLQYTSGGMSYAENLPNPVSFHVTGSFEAGFLAESLRAAATAVERALAAAAYCEEDFRKS